MSYNIDNLQAHHILGHKTPNVHGLYMFGKKLGQGEFGTTYVCTEIASGIKYACKSILKKKLISKQAVEDVRREVQIMQYLADQKNIVKIKGAYEDPLYVHIVMELCSGGQVFIDRVGSPYYMAPEAINKHYGPEADVWSPGVILYILLSGVPPFWAEPWPQISDSSKDLIQKMLCLRPSERLTAGAVLSKSSLDLPKRDISKLKNAPRKYRKSFKVKMRLMEEMNISES
ncbi:hypothetical protein CRYUN_Cryun09bG0110200 [Craigia yunnanensis]